MRREPITLQEANGILLAANRDSSICGRRDSCIIVLMVSFGFRARQLISLRLADYNPRKGSLIVGSPVGRLLHLRAPVRTLMNQWIRIRGSAAGPLFNKITQSRFNTIRPLGRSDISYMLARRVSEAELRPFSIFDVVHTHSLMTYGVWESGTDPSTEAFILVQTMDPATRRFRLSFETNSAIMNKSGIDAARLLVRFLSHHTRRRRAVMKHNLDLLANEITGNTEAATLDWCRLAAGKLPSLQSLTLRFTRRKANAIANVFYDLLKVALAMGVYDELACNEFRNALSR